jgi:hypothetical protein
VIAALLLSCSPSYHDPTDISLDPGSGGQVEETLFVNTTTTGGNPLIEFETADLAYLSPYGYTLWSLKGPHADAFTSRRVMVDKTSGEAAAGYGVLFCHHAASDPNDEAMLIVMINTRQEYIVGEAQGGTFSRLIDWTYSSALKPGYNQENIIQVDLDRPTRTFTLRLNGNEVNTFTPSTTTYELGGGSGYIVVISPRDSFPGTPVHVLFQERTN